MSKFSNLRDLGVLGASAALIAVVAVDVFDADQLIRKPKRRITPEPVEPEAPHGWLHSARSGEAVRPATREERQASVDARRRFGADGLFAYAWHGGGRTLVLEDDRRFPEATVYFVDDPYLDDATWAVEHGRAVTRPPLDVVSDDAELAETAEAVG